MPFGQGRPPTDTVEVRWRIPRKLYEWLEKNGGSKFLIKILEIAYASGKK